MRTILTKGDKVEVIQSWRDWKIGDVAIIENWDFEHGRDTDLQLLTLKDISNKEHDSDTLYDYQVKFMEKK